MQKWRKHLQQVIKKGGKNEEKNMKKSIQKKGRKTERPPSQARAPPWCRGDIQINKIEYNLSEEKQK